jgi:hypothetical protein
MSNCMEISDLFARMRDVDSDVRDSLEPAIAGCAEFSEIIQEMLTLALELQRQVTSSTLLQIAFSPSEGIADVDKSPKDEGLRSDKSVIEFINTLIPVTIHSIAQYYGDSITQESTMINARYQEMLQSLSHQSKMVDRNIQTALIPAFTTLGSAIFPQGIPPPLPAYEAGDMDKGVTVPQGIGQIPSGILSPIQPAIQKMDEALFAPLLVGEGGLKSTINLITSYKTTTTTLTKLQDTFQQALNEGYAPSTIPFAERRDIHERQVPLITAASSLTTLQKVFNPLYEISADVPEAQRDSSGMVMRETQASRFISPAIQPQTIIEPAKEDRIEQIFRPRFEIAAFTPHLTEHIAPVRPKGMVPPSETERSEAELSHVAHPTQGLPVVVQAFSSSTTAARNVINELNRSFIPLIESTGGAVSPGMLFNGTAIILDHSPLFDKKKAQLSNILSTEKMAISTAESARVTTIVPQFPLLNLAATISPLQQIAPSLGGITGKSLSHGTESPQFNLPMAVTTVNEAFSVLENIHLLTTQPGKAPVTVQPASLPSHIGTLTQNITLTHSGGMAATPSPKNEVTVHNTFNIEIAMRGQGDEGELRELGQKIGTILSEELKRYGGLTWR